MVWGDYRLALSGYHNVRIAKNRILNVIDPPVVILIYHRVTTLPSDPQQLAVSPDNFLYHLRYIKENFPVLRFEDEWPNLKEPSVVVTFDDGYADNVREALPLLEKAGIPATFFISTGGLGSNREFWWDELERILLVEREFPPTFNLQDEGFGRKWSTKSNADRSALYEEIHLLIKQVGAVRREDWFRQLRAWAGIAKDGRVTHRIMTVNELQKLASSRLVTIGAHTVSHTPLATLSSAEQQQEILASKLHLQELIGREVTVFSYPFGGKEDFTSETVHFCRNAGFVKAASNFPGQAHRWTNPFLLPRQLVRNWDVSTFASKMRMFQLL